ncbi:integrase, catalytic region, zinc finger, CCHC-type containing protein [Tanacetum coccineum]|uniref:Integrase, catalytic region, zinc finger, CCHC-type containing protein n=1 Tax=Tanacetum coccineum TaxID=301880 RepID=A0ABQ5APT2_9ASTR
MHNHIMAAGSKERPPMLDQGDYSQWHSRFLRTVDHKSNGEYQSSASLTFHCQASQEIDTVSYHKLFDVLKQFQNEVNDIRSERLARSANPLALLAAAQPYSDNYYQAPVPQISNAPSYKQSSSTRSTATTRQKGKEIAKPVTPQSESVSEEDSDPEQARRDKDMQKNLALLAKYFKKLYKPTNNNLRTSSNSTNKTEDTTPRYNNDNQSRAVVVESNDRPTVCWARNIMQSVVQKNGIQCFNCKGFGHYARECGNGYLTKRRKTKQKATKQDTRWKSV